MDPTDFARVLAGRDPRTGLRLITARGSAGRRPTLGAGNETRSGPDGGALYGVDDIAATIGVTKGEAQALVAAGERLAVRALTRVREVGSSDAVVEPEGSYLVPWIAADGSRWVTDAELERCEQTRAVGVAASQISAAGDSTDQLSVPEAARLAGVTARYLRSLCRRWDEHRQGIEACIAEGKASERAYVVAHCGTRGQWIVIRRELAAFLERRTAPAVRVGYDLTLTTEKSLGVLALLSDDATRRVVLDAIESGNDTGISYLELHAGAARAKGKPVLVRGLTVASFPHLTSRALDPFPHHHNVIANTVIDEHGSRRALDARGLFTHAQAASALATAQMRHELTRALGVRWRRGRSGSWEIDGIEDDVLREFSRRRSEIEDAVAELEAEIGRQSTLDEVHTIITSTRPAKEHVDTSALVAGWWERARRLGFSPQDLEHCTGHHRARPGLDEDALFERLASPVDGVCADTSMFTRSDVLVALADIAVNTDAGPGPLLVAAAEMERLADAFLASGLVVQLDTHAATAPSGLVSEELYTTGEILGVQQRILGQYRSGLTATAALVPSDVIERALADHPSLTGEQRQLVTAVCSSGQTLQCAIGRAGAGKTTTMRAAAAAWRAAGYEVVGAAVKGEATRHLAAGAGIPAETIAWYLARTDNPPLHERTVLIIDEASTISDRDLDAVLHVAQRTDATLRLIGDPDQHGAVTAGGMFRHLCETDPHRTPELATAHRVTDPSDREAARLLRAGRTKDALARLADVGHLHVADNDIDLYIGMLRNWWDGHQDGALHPMVDRRHHTRRVLNRLARRLRRANNELGNTEIIATGDRAFAEGDRVVARMAARHLHVDTQPGAYVRNGAVGTITAVYLHDDSAKDTISVCFDDIGEITIPRAFFDEHTGPGGRRDVGIDHAYAVTSYAVQGATFEVSTSRIDEGASRAETYVDITRGRSANHLFITRAVDPLDGEHLPKAPEPELHDSVADRLRRSGPERAAIEFAGVEHSLAVARLAARQPPPAWTARLPEPTDGPCHLRREWSDALEAVLAYRQQWTPRPGSCAWEWAVGATPGDRHALSERQRAIELLDRYATAVASEELGAVGVISEWAIEKVRSALSSGVPTTGLGPLVDVCHRIDAARREVELADVPETGAAVSVGDLLQEFAFDRWLANQHERLRSDLATSISSALGHGRDFA